MKKLILFLPLILALSLFTSCKRNYTCTCTSDVDGTIVNLSEYNLTKEDAESACSNADMQVGVSCVLELAD